MRVIFLDIDGVLATSRAHIALGKYGGIWTEWDPVGVALVKKLCKEHNLKLVISSTWRFNPSQSGIMDCLEVHGLQAYLNRGAPYTPDFRGNGDQRYRGYEIQAYLGNNLDIDRYLIFDDDSDFLPHQREYHIHTETHNGITAANYFKCLDILKEWDGK